MTSLSERASSGRRSGASGMRTVTAGQPKRRVMRMKEDNIDHDWAYRLTETGRRRLGDEPPEMTIDEHVQDGE